MRNILAITRREVLSYFTTPIAYAVFFVFSVITGYFFLQILAQFQKMSLQFMQYQRAELLEQINLTDMVMRPLLLNTAVIMIFMVPILTMRLLAEEKKSKTWELLMTSPVTITEIVAGKYLATLVVVFAMLVVTMFFPLSVHLMASKDGGQGLSWGTMFALYLGLFLLGGCFTAVGLLTSATTENQVVAAVWSFVALLLLWVLNWAASSAEGAAKEILTQVSLLDHVSTFSKGVIELKSVVYYVSFVFFGLFLTNRILEAQRWD